MNKVKPNKNALTRGSINCTQKPSNIAKIKEEQGITLIALLVTVILLVILVGVAVSQITGDEGIIVGTEEAVDDYKYQQYKEQIEQLVHSIILADSLAGRTTTVTSMAEDMEQESWIKSAVPNEESKDIIVTVQEGYVYQVYYDELTGMSSVDNVGTEDGASLPTVTATYNKETYTIEVTASCEDGITKIELIYGGEVVQTAEVETASFEVEESGWYQVKATSGKGKTRYANVRVSNEVGAPSIEVTSNGESENDWYGKDNVPVEVTISTEEGNVSGIYYKKNTDTDYTYVEGKSTLVTINTSGRTVIYAYAVDGRGNESDIVRIEVKYDNVVPQVGAVAVSPEVPASGWYNTDVVVSIPNAEDANSGIAGYYYWEVVGDVAEVPDEEKTYVSGASKTLTVKSEGIKTIAFQAIDKAGNKSGISNITIKKDSLSPKDFTISVSNQNKTGFTINAGTTDDTSMASSVSGMSHYEIYMNGSLKDTIEVTDENNPTVSYVAENLSENTAYTVSVKAYDKAGNVKDSASMIGQTGDGSGGTEEPDPGGDEDPDNPGGSEDTELPRDPDSIDFGNLTDEVKNSLIGKYVDYTPIAGVYRDHNYSNYSGTSNSQLLTDMDVAWRILFVDENTLTLISEEPVHSGFKLSGANGYNNGVLLLNNACEELYSNKLLGAIGRSLNIDDIESVSTYDKTTYTNYGKEYSLSNAYYPNIFALEITGAPEGTYGTSYNLSDQDEYVIGSKQTTRLTVKQTYYTYTMSTANMASEYLELFRYKPETTTNLNSYWLASRCVNYQSGSNAFGFRIFSVSDGMVVTPQASLATSINGSNDTTNSLRPVVEIDLSKVNVGVTGEGSMYVPYSITSRGKLPKVEEERDTTLAGKYIDYTPLEGVYTDHTYDTYSGNSNSQLLTDTNVEWRILYSTETKLVITTEIPVHKGFNLKGAAGYNNGVLLLNKACEELYSNKLLGATGRSINIKDIENVSSYDKTTYTNYGNEYSPSDKYYPNIFALEITGAPEGTYGTSYNLSEQDEYVTGSKEASILKGKHTYYTYEISESYMTSEYLDLFRYKPGTTDNLDSYWFASRCVQYDSDNNRFRLGLFEVKSGKVDAEIIYNSKNQANVINAALRPVVEIDLSKVNVGVTGDGSKYSPYSITARTES